jgi:hypothetical protein
MKEVLVKAYNLVGKIEQYHDPLRRPYKIIYNVTELEELGVQLNA